MKRAVKVLLAFLIIATTLVSTVSCKDDGPITYTENELTYVLPQDMTERNYEYIPIAYSNNEAKFVLMVFGRREFATDWYISEDFDVVSVTETFIEANKYGVGYNHDKERDVTTFSALATEYEDSEELDYFAHLIAVTEGYVYIVTMHCDEVYAEKYTPIFESWLSQIKVAR